MRYLTGRNLAAREGGMTLMIVMIALVSLSMAALALIRSIDTSTLVMGNLGFKQATTARADSAAEVAMTYVSGKYAAAPTDLYDSRCASGCSSSDSTTAYYATSLDPLDISGHSTNVARYLADWDNDGCAYATAGTYTLCLKTSPPVTINGFETRYLIARMCRTTGDPNSATNSCSIPTTVGATRKQINKGEIKYGMTTMLKDSSGGSGGSGALQMFRIVVRAKGPRNTVSYTETYVSSLSQ